MAQVTEMRDRFDTGGLTVAVRPDGAARALGVSRRKVFDLLRTGRLRSVKIDGARLIPVEAIEALLKAAADAGR